MTVTVYGIHNCDQVRKTLRWLTQHHLTHRFHDFRADGLTRATLRDWQDRVGLKALVNRRSQTWRTLSPAQQSSIATDPDKAISLLLEHPTLIKRPVIVQDGPSPGVQVGFQEDALRSLLKAD